MGTKNAANNNNWPNMIDIDVAAPPKSHVTYPDVVKNTDNPGPFYGRYRVNNTGAQNSEIVFEAPLKAGSWNFELAYGKGSGNGIFTVQVGGVSIGTIDGYNGSVVWNNQSTIAFTVSTSSVYEVRILMATKNASATAYFGSIEFIRLLRTGN